MVNQPTLHLLERLKATDRSLSGEVLAGEFGISRVALWKRIEGLRAAGYPVEGSPSGYRLIPSDPIQPWEFPEAPDAIHSFGTLASTMDKAFELASAGAVEGTVVHAEAQTAGRGQQGRPWQSLAGNLSLTLVLRPPLPAAYAGAVCLESVCVLADILHDLYGVETTFKWPNDLLADGRKVAGVLVESFGPADRPRWFLVGFGINVRAVPELERHVTSLEAIAGHPVDRRDIVRALRTRLTSWSNTPVLSPDRWARHHVATTSWRIETWDGQNVLGTPSGFERDGSLLLSHHAQPTPLRYGTTVRIEGALP